MEVISLRMHRTLMLKVVMMIVLGVGGGSDGVGTPSDVDGQILMIIIVVGG